MVYRGFSRSARLAAAISALVLGVMPMSAGADIVHNDDVIILFSLCVGNDCVNGESFGFDTIRLKENNLRIHFDDTSNTASFPSNDWRLVANDSSNGGLSHFSIDDVTGARTPFRIEASAPSSSLYVDDGGRIGLGTSTPVVELHVVDGDTPTLRLEQDGSSGFQAQTWDVAGNETNFFVRDVTNGSRLAFRIRPNAPSNSIFVDTDGDVGLGTSTPAEKLHLLCSDCTELKLRIDENTDNAWAFSVVDSNATRPRAFRISKQGTGGPEVDIIERNDPGGQPTMDVSGSIRATNVTFTSSRARKKDFEELDVDDVLAKVAALEMTSWRYKEGSPGRHIGPVAEDFQEIFGLGEGSEAISVVDANGVALAAIQALTARNEELAVQNRKLEERLELLESRVVSGD